MLTSAGATAPQTELSTRRVLCPLFRAHSNDAYSGEPFICTVIGRRGFLTSNFRRGSVSRFFEPTRFSRFQITGLPFCSINRQEYTKFYMWAGLDGRWTLGLLTPDRLKTATENGLRPRESWS